MTVTVYKRSAFAMYTPSVNKTFMSEFSWSRMQSIYETKSSRANVSHSRESETQKFQWTKFNEKTHLSGDSSTDVRGETKMEPRPDSNDISISYPSTTPVKLSKTQKNPIVEEPNAAGNLFWPIICLLKFTGNCSLSYIPIGENQPKNGDSPGRKLDKARLYKILFLSKSTMLSFAIGILALVIWTIKLYENILEQDILHCPILSSYYTLHHFFKRDSSSNAARTSVDHTVKVMFCCAYLMQALEIIFAWLESKDLGKFLNKFLQFQKDFSQAFPLAEKHLPRPNIKEIRNLFLLFYITIPSLLGMTTLYSFNSLPHFSVLGFSTTILINLQCTFVSLLEDAKVILSYLSLGDAFRQIKLGITHSLQFESLTEEKVKSWRKVIHHVRMQVNYAGQWQKSHQLMLLVGLIILMTCSAFMILLSSEHFPITDNTSFSIFVKIGYILLLAMRIYLKIHAANVISQEESLIARELIIANVPILDLATQIEVKFLLDMIKQKPCVINFGSYVTLNKSLILGIAGQVVTYLIVLLQFYQS